MKKEFEYFIIIFIVLFVIFESVLFFSVKYFENHEKNLYLNTIKKINKNYTDYALSFLEEKANILFHEDFNNSFVKKILFKASLTNNSDILNKLRKELYKKYKSKYHYFKRLGIRQFHFHLPHAISFLRFHKVNKYGDNLWNIRETIKFVNLYKKSVHAYEEGRIFNGFRNVYPIFYKNKFVGSVELSYSFLALKKEIAKVDKSSYLFIVSSKIAENKLFLDELKKNYLKSEFKGFDYDKYTLINNNSINLKVLRLINKNISYKIINKLKKGEFFSISYFNPSILNKKLIITFIPIKNFKSKVSAYIINYREDKLNFLIKNLHKFFIILTILDILFSFFISFFIFKEMIHKKKFYYASIQDELTGIYNRKAINKYLKDKIKEFNFSGKKFGIIFFDIDNFKRINDTYGHDKGDFVLKKIADIIKNNIRKDDFFGRWGGEEFIIILNEENFNNLCKIAEKLRKIIEKSDFDNLNVTSSFGVTMVKKYDDENSIIRKVDKALYEAKEKGRNRVICKR